MVTIMGQAYTLESQLPLWACSQSQKDCKGFDAVHEKLPTEGLYREENVICNVGNDD